MYSSFSALFCECKGRTDGQYSTPGGPFFAPFEIQEGKRCMENDKWNILSIGVSNGESESVFLIPSRSYGRVSRMHLDRDRSHVLDSYYIDRK
jgi:hypothetical protein